MTDRTETARQETRPDPLIDFSDRWKLDGDYLRCRCCKRPQIVSCALQDFPHAADCRHADAERNPWKTLTSLLSAKIARAVCAQEKAA